MSIPLVYFLLIACPMGLINLFGYTWMIYSFTLTLLMAVLTMEFLILRAINVSNKLIKKFSENQVAKYDLQQNRLKMLKPRKYHLKIMRSINDIVKQFSVSSIVIYAH